jgi:hypothetical protein
MATLSAGSCDFSRQLFKDGERYLILSNCLVCGEARIGSSYDGSIQEWESGHTCASCLAKAAPRLELPAGFSRLARRRQFSVG